MSFDQPTLQDKMWKNACVLTRLVSVSVQAAENAGITIKNVMNSGNLQIVNKDLEGKTKDLQTEADRSAQAGIEAKLKSAFGEALQIVGEEELPEQIATVDPNASTTEKMKEVLTHDGEIPENLRQLQVQDFLVWVDPLDGTGEFVRALKDPTLLQQVTVLIGITHQGNPIAGVVHQPYYKRPGNEGQGAADGRTIWGICRVGTFGIDKFPQKEPQVLEAVTTASHSTKLVEDALEALTNNGLINSVKRVGGAGYKVLCCLEGATAYVFASGGCKKWDTAAPEAILKAAGGDLTDISGRQIFYEQHGQMQNSGGVLATASGVQHQKYVEAIPQHVKDQLPEKLPK